MTIRKITFASPGVYRISVPDGVESYGRVRMWGGGGQAGYNTSGQTGGSGSGSDVCSSDLVY